MTAEVGLSKIAKEQCTFFARCRNSSSLLSVLEILCKEYSDKIVCLEVLNRADDEVPGLQCRAIDGGHVSFLDSFFPNGPYPSTFSIFECSTEYLQIWLNPKALSKAISSCTEKSILTLMVKVDSPDILSLTSVISTKYGVVKSMHYEIDLLNPLQGDEAFVDGGDFIYTVSMYSEVPLLMAEILQDLKSSDCEKVYLEIKNKTLLVCGSSSSSSGNMKVELKSDDECATSKKFVIASTTEEGHSECFIFRHLFKLHRLFKVSSQVLLEMGPEAPLSAVFDMKGGATCQCFIAPSIED